MRIVGIRREGGEVVVASLSDDDTQATVLACLEEFWSDAAGFLSREPAGPTVPTAGLREDARTCCASLEAGVGRRVALRARWLPRSLWQRPEREPSDHDDLVGV